ncbi:hypothetical protein NW768_010667 [Fusarium equiseti]|uniref:Transposase n=1 Tax=Fusarium equiseti TaxID=61235 RepID=A0ABQ8QZV0_FUSEQ|nr:hypothetical protein NW768_010667 [Fusarium equiseti]
MSKGKNKAFNYDDHFRLTLQDLKDNKQYLKSKDNCNRAKRVLDRYHEAIASPNMHRKGAEELKRYITDEDWLQYLNQTQSQTRLYKRLTCNGRTRPILHFAG